jgi:hypothetical protein
MSASTEPPSIGVATLEEGGVLVLQLRAEGERGLVGDARLTYRPEDPQYQSILRHLGGLSIGESKPVPPFDR